MNLVSRQIYGNKKSVIENTFIGGVSTINTPALLASKLGISVGSISNFSVVGSDIKCKITGSYAMPNYAFASNSSITYYRDLDGLCNVMGIGSFSIVVNCKEIYFPNISAVPRVVSNWQFQGDGLDVIYLPRALTWGSTTGQEVDVFRNDFTTAKKIYVHPSLATSNAGNLEGDLAYVQTLGASIVFVSNFTAPNPITTLATGTIYSTAVKLNFTPPTGNTNAIDFYECYANGVLKNTITSSGQYITGLTASTNYNITVIAVDVFYNKSVFSNSLSATTNTTSAVTTTGLVSYYKLESSSIDSIGINNGADTSISYSNGRVSNAAVLNGISSKVLLGNNASLKLSNVSISCWIKSTNAGSGDRGLMFKRYAYNLFFYGGKLATYSYGSPAGYKDTGINICNGNWRHIVLTQQSGVTNGTKIYLDGSLVLITTVAQTAQTDQLEIGTIGGVGFSNFSIDEASVYNSILTESQIQLLYNNGNGTTL